MRFVWGLCVTYCKTGRKQKRTPVLVRDGLCDGNARAPAAAVPEGLRLDVDRRPDLGQDYPLATNMSHSTLALAVVGCHSAWIYAAVLLPVPAKWQRRPGLSCSG